MAAKRVDFQGVITAMVTPMDKDLKVNYKRAQELAAKLVENGSSGLVLAGTTGESPTLTHEEELQLFKEIKEAVGGKAKIIAGTGSNDTQTAIRATQAAEKAGVDGALVVVPYYNKPPQEGMFQHFKAVAESTSLPILIYNIPGRTGVNMLPNTVARLAEMKNVAGMKDSTGNLDQASEMMSKVPDDFVLLSGDDPVTLHFLGVGATGVISVVSHIAGKDIAGMIREYQKGNLERARDIHFRLLPLCRAVFVTTNPIGIKCALHLSGFDAGGLRLPLIPASEKERQTISKALKDYGIITE